MNEKINIKYIKHVFRIIGARSWNWINISVGDFFEKYFLTTKSKTLTYPPLFILGAPRSGSTVLFQIITDAFDVGYLSNRHCRWFGAPALVERHANPQNINKPSDFSSVHGSTTHDYDPAECGAWWYRFFRKNSAYVTGDQVDLKKMHSFRRSVLSLDQAVRKPLVFKNLYAGLRLEPIVEALPEALFLIIERDLLDNAQSILKGRYDISGSYDRWWGMFPPNGESLISLSPVEQVVGQIKAVNSLIDSDLKRLVASDRLIHIRYEDLCKDVHRTIDEIRMFFQKMGVELKPRFEVPKQFKVRKSVAIPQNMFDELCRFIGGKSGNFNDSDL